MFFKLVLDEFPLYRTYDHKIILENNILLGYYPFY
jgi:hypothetical protein